MKPQGLLLLGASALVLVASLARGTFTAAGPAPASSAAAPEPPSPLPSGASEDARLGDAPRSGCSFEEPAEAQNAPFLPLRAFSHGAVVARVAVPAGALDEGGAFDLLVHFHGAEAARRVVLAAGAPLVFVGIDAGAGSSAYESIFEGKTAFSALLRSVESQVGLSAGRLDARVHAVAVSAWSAGYGAVGSLLRGGETSPRAWLLLDGLHAAFDPSGRPSHADLAPFFSLSRRAAGREQDAGPGPLFLFTHTEIATENYASTSETAAALVGALGQHEIPVDPGDGRDGALISIYEEGKFVVRGYAGANREAHCAALGQLGTIVKTEVLPVLVGD